MGDDPSAATIEGVLSFWFDEHTVEDWFTKSPAFDRACRERLAELSARAASGALDHWRDSPEGCVALCILLDQVPRNLHRDDARAFATDAIAREITRHALSRGLAEHLPQVQRMFLYLPLEHSESLDDQELCVRLMGELDQDPAWRDYSVRHRDIIARFGRFPHRNAILGRDSTPEEVEFLSQPGSSF